MNLVEADYDAPRSDLHCPKLQRHGKSEWKKERGGCRFGEGDERAGKGSLRGH